MAIGSDADPMIRGSRRHGLEAFVDFFRSDEDPMKRGSRRDDPITVLLPVRMSCRPDEKGIKTYPDACSECRVPSDEDPMKRGLRRDFVCATTTAKFQRQTR